MRIQLQSADLSDSSMHKSFGPVRSSRLPQQVLQTPHLVATLLLVLLVVTSQANLLAQEPPLPPFAQDDWQVTDYDQETFIDVTLNDYGMSAPLDLTTVQITMQPFFGTVTVDPVTGVVAYLPDGDYAGQDWFQYSVKDTLGQETIPALVTIDLMNMPPMITDFEVIPGPLDTWTFRGKVWDENPDVMTVRLTGIVNEPDVPVEFDGSFSTTITLDPNDFGTVFADTDDEVGAPSNTALITAGYYN